MFEACQPPVTNAVKRELSAKQRVQLFYGDWKVEFVSNALRTDAGVTVSMKTNNGFRQFTFECVWNVRNGNVSNVKVAAKKTFAPAGSALTKHRPIELHLTPASRSSGTP